MKYVNSSSRHRFFAAVWVAVLLQPHAADLSNVPLATLEASVVVKPNVMFLLDTSGSMSQDYTPDWVNDSGLNYCLLYYLNSKMCKFGMPPYNSPDFNAQYYNPSIRYDPPKDSNGVSRKQMNSANTTAWTAVPVDAYGKEGFESFAGATANFDLVTKYPDVLYSSSSSSTTDAKRNTAQAGATVNDYIYPDSTYQYVSFATTSTAGAGGPYYYTIGTTYYCTNDEFTDCKSISAPSGSYSVPAKYLWCDSATIATAQCQARRTQSKYKYVSFYGGSIPASAGAVATGSFTVNQAGSGAISTTTTISSVKITTSAGTYELLSSSAAVTAIDDASKRTSLAAAIASKISGGGGGCTYSATSSSNQVTISSAEKLSACNGTVVITSNDVTSGTVTHTFQYDTKGVSNATASAADNVSNTISFADVTSGGSSSNFATFTLNLDQVGNSAVKSTTTITSVKINGVEAMGSSAVYDGVESSTKRTDLESQIASKINSYVSVSGPDWTASISSSKVSIKAPAKGSAYNGYSVSLTWKTVTDSPDGVTHTVTFSPASGSIALAGGSAPTSAVTIPASIFKRVDIIPATTTYSKAATRSDCSSLPSNCSYAEEMTNFANWFSYYRTRIQTMKTAVSLAFVSLTDAYRVGFIDIQGTNFRKLDTFDATNKAAWFSHLFAQTTHDSTPLRTALSRVGRYYAGKTDGINSGTTSSDPNPIQYSCQQNFTIMTTDGYWNGGGGVKLDGTAMDNQDIPDSGLTARAGIGVYDGYPLATSSSGSYGSLADVASYYYKNDLQPDDTATYAGNDIGQDNVPVSTDDTVNHQHMVTFTLGLGVDGRLKYNSNYQTDLAGDFNKIKTGVTGCNWESATGNICNWPVPSSGGDTAVDDLWHAAVNGRGKYFSAKSPDQVVTGLSDALAKIQSTSGAAAAAATSSPVITEADNQFFLTTYTTVEWSGEVLARTIDPTTGALSSNVAWQAQALLDAADPTTRVIYTRDNAGARVDFKYASLDSTAQNYFNSSGKANTLPQFSSLSGAQQVLLTDGAAMVDYLRGVKTNEGTVYRARAHTLGDTVNAAPKYVGKPTRSYLEHDYVAGFKASHASRLGVLYVAANDGMLHAFQGSDGKELWAYVPRMIMPEMVRLASSTYATTHTYFVDGSPNVEDVWDATAGAWKTILVAGLNGGGMSDPSKAAGRGYYALDITNPNDPKPLWEFCSDSSLCSKSDSKLGYTFGNSLIGKRARDGKWVVYVSSGYANGSGSTLAGNLFTLDAITGTVLETSATGTDGLGRINGFLTNASSNNTIQYIYGGDLQGYVYEFDTSAATMAARQIAKLSFSGTEQAITTKPIITTCQGKRLVLVGTGRYLGTSDVASTAQNSVYAFTTDIPSGSQTLNGNSSMVKQLVDYSNTSNIVITSSTTPDLTAQYGWYLDFQSNSGERVNVDPLLALGNFVVVTNIPNTTSAAACSTAQGKSRAYNFDYCSGLLYTGFNNITETDGQIVGNTLGILTTGENIRFQCKVDGTCEPLPIASGASAFIQGAGRVSWRELISN